MFGNNDLPLALIMEEILEWNKGKKAEDGDEQEDSTSFDEN